MFIGAHNTMTYLPPKQWWLRPFKFIAQCQRKDYKTLHEKYDVDAFDLRMFYDKSHNLEFRHGPYRYDANNFEEVLQYCNDNKLYVRFLFEYRKTTEKRDDIDELKRKFKELCQEVEEKYTDIKFYGGYVTETCESLYTFKNNVEEAPFYSSTTSLFGEDDYSWTRYIDDWCPWIYAKLFNKKNFEANAVKYADTDICVVYDFNDIR